MKRCWILNFADIFILVSVLDLLRFCEITLFYTLSLQCCKLHVKEGTSAMLLIYCICFFKKYYLQLLRVVEQPTFFIF